MKDDSEENISKIELETIGRLVENIELERVESIVLYQNF